MNIPAAKIKWKTSDVRKLCSVLICHALSHLVENVSRNVTDLCAREKL